MTGLRLHYGDLTDGSCLARLIFEIKPDEVYNLAAQSHVKVSFDLAEYTANVDAVGALRILDAIKMAGLEKTTKFYQASTSELYGKVHEVPQREVTPFHPRSPYGELIMVVRTFCCNHLLSKVLQNFMHTGLS